jgi:XTP/dITP diphosphohydrolase
VTSSNAVPPRGPGPEDVLGGRLLELIAVVDTLRRSCPWDREQTHASLLRYLLEEAYEAAETIEADDMPALREEIGDVLFQVLFHARIASERSAADGGFTIDDVADTLAAKLIRRHPHVFAGVSVSSAADVNANWEEIKQAERAQKAAETESGPPSVLDGVVFGQPALSLAAQLQRRGGGAGFPTSLPPSGRDDGRATPSQDVGDELFRLVARASEAGIDPELELRSAARRYADLIRSWERSGSQQLSDSDED